MSSAELMQYLFLLLACLGVLFLAAAMYLSWRWVGRKRRLAAYHGPGLTSSSLLSALYAQGPETVVPPRWMAIHCSNRYTAQRALGLENARPCSLEEGLSKAHEHQLFISQPLLEWVLVLGPGLPDPVEDPDLVFHFVRGLSRKCGQVQLFAANATTRAHAWIMADSGEVARAYVWSEETLWNQGRTTAAESELGLLCFHYAERPALDTATRAALATNVGKVPLLAGRWGINPFAINPRFLRQSKGVVGEVSHARRR